MAARCAMRSPIHRLDVLFSSGLPLMVGTRRNHAVAAWDLSASCRPTESCDPSGDASSVATSTAHSCRHGQCSRNCHGRNLSLVLGPSSTPPQQTVQSSRCSWVSSRGCSSWRSSQQTAIWGVSTRSGCSWAFLVPLRLACLAALLDNAAGRHQGSTAARIFWRSCSPSFMAFALGLVQWAPGIESYVGAAVFWGVGCLVMAPYLLRAGFGSTETGRRNVAPRIDTASGSSIHETATVTALLAGWRGLGRSSWRGRSLIFGGAARTHGMFHR